jgi:flagellar biosynthesis GTPase FlhF
MELEYFRDILDKALKPEGESIWFLMLRHIKGDFGLPPQPLVLADYLKSNFDVTEKGPNNCEWIRVESSPNIVELLEQGKEPDLHNILTKTIKYRTLEYNKNPLSVVPYYRLKETIDEDWKIAQGNQERKAKEEAERKAKEEAERKAKEEAERKAKEEAERKAKEEAERKAKEEAERKAKEEAERKAKEEAERKAKEEAERKAKEEAERKAKEEAERKAKEEAERSSYKSLIEEFVSETKECEYKDGIIFGKKKTIRYVATPITKHIWNAVVNKSAESDFEDDEYVPQKELGDFIEELNAHFKGRVVFEYLHKNIHANVHLQVYEKLDKNASFVFIKEDNR